MEAQLREVMAQAPDNHHAYNALGYSLAERNVRLQEALRADREGARDGAGRPLHHGQHGLGALPHGQLERGRKVPAPRVCACARMLKSACTWVKCCGKKASKPMPRHSGAMPAPRTRRTTPCASTLARLAPVACEIIHPRSTVSLPMMLLIPTPCHARPCRHGPDRLRDKHRQPVHCHGRRVPRTPLTWQGACR